MPTVKVLGLKPGPPANWTVTRHLNGCANSARVPLPVRTSLHYSMSVTCAHTLCVQPSELSQSKPTHQTSAQVNDQTVTSIPLFSPGFANCRFVLLVLNVVSRE